MKKFLFVFVAMLFCISCFGFSSYNFCFADEKIVVYGEGEIKFVPDLAVVTVGVETINENLLVAQKQNSDATSSVIETLKQFDVKQENIKTKNYNVYQKYDYSTSPEKLIGFQISNYIEFKTKAVDNVSQIISTLMGHGANTLNGVNFTLENFQSAYNSALKLAFENAKSKASVFGIDNYELAEIEEQNCCNSFVNETYVYAKGGGENMTIMKGEILIKALIKVVFEID